VTSGRRRARLSDEAAPELLWSARALADLRGIGDFIARDDPEAARRWVLKLTRAAERAKAFPESGRIVPEAGRREIREILVRNYRIVYRIRPGRVEVLTVFEGHRLFVTGDVPEEP